MKRIIKVFVGDEASSVGTLQFDAVGSRERAAFSYADAWLVSADRFALEALVSVLSYFQISAARAKKILSRIEHALSRWREVGATLGITNKELDQFADAFEHPEREAARKTIRRNWETPH